MSIHQGKRLLATLAVAAALPLSLPAVASAAAGPVDLGLLPGDELTTVTAVGDRGQLVGESCGTEPHTHFCTAVKWDRTGRISVLPSLGGGFGSPKAINGTGVAVGNSTGRDLSTRAVRWSPDGAITELPASPGGRTWEATGISTLGVIVGSGQDAGSRQHGLRWDPSGNVTVLAAPPVAGNYHATAISRDGRFIAGQLHGDDGLRRVLRWDASGAVTMFASTEDSWFGELNASGEIVGRTTVNDRYAAVKWTADGRMTELGWLNSYATEALGLNGSGVSVGMGYVDSPSGSLPAPVRWASDGTMTLLSGTDGQAEDIDPRGRIVGRAGNAALWDANGVRTDLGTLPGGGFSRAQLIGPDGTIAGGAVAADGNWHAVYWPAR
ncbi:hypothetical protein BS329_10480 [Amycolatopsis coloradensis]|uniref:HAF repeat-containing protein n=1 Tax=Amycolatopsis coloradensis TaxID=76021 RepID=A0A1R0KW80_9PSEU|nr:hypothetical protein [Amycolatopsis coloradensis]OLZ53237.1 hypothetical protein BS329_10480 [Amycolatopsis coloradensis]